MAKGQDYNMTTYSIFIHRIFKRYLCMKGLKLFSKVFPPSSIKGKILHDMTTQAQIEQTSHFL